MGTIRSLKSKLACAETKLEENLRTVSLLRNKMSRFERQFRKQMNGDPNTRKIYYDIEKDMEKLRREIYSWQKQSDNFMAILGLAAETNGNAQIFENIAQCWNSCSEYIDREDMALQLREYFEAVEEANRESAQKEVFMKIEQEKEEIRMKKMKRERAESEAAIKIQSNWRGHEVRKQMHEEEEAKNELLRQEEAATKIQATWKGREARKSLLKQEEAATKIQATWKGREARKSFEARKSLIKKEKEAAATKIQATWKGHEVRKELANSAVEEENISSDDYEDEISEKSADVQEKEEIISVPETKKEKEVEEKIISDPPKKEEEEEK